jgi:hypothetical protein
MINQKPLSKPYLFYMTFWALLGLFPVMTDYFLQTYGTNWFLFAPHPTNLPGILIYAIGSAALSIAILHFAIKYNKTEKLEYLTVCVFRYSLAFAMIIFYGYGKLVTKQFQINYLSLETPMKDVSSAHLTWYFFGRSNAETFLYGLFEFIPGVLLLFRRTTLLGAITLFPVLANVLLVNIFNQIEGGHTYTFSVAFLSFNFGLFLYYRHELITLFKSASTKLQRGFKGRLSASILNGLKIIFIGLIFLKFGKGIYIVATTGTELSKVKSKCFGIYQLRSISYNNIPQNLDSLKNYWKKLYFEKREYWNFKLKDKNDSLVHMHYTFFNNKDSIRITTYSKFDENENPLDSTVFTGTYFLANNDSTMNLKGIKNDTLINAVYKKLPVDGHDWWW